MNVKCSKCCKSIEVIDLTQEEEDDNDNKYGASKNVGVEKKERKSCGISKRRRKRNMWTSEEEETLKMGVLLLTSPEDKVIPWERILDFGDHVFKIGRNSVDLKDKWRNICKAAKPKPKPKPK